MMLTLSSPSRASLLAAAILIACSTHAFCQVDCRLPPYGGDGTLCGREPTHANANNDADPRDPFLVPGFEPVSAQAFAVQSVSQFQRLVE
jgi:hypothetical protein